MSNRAGALPYQMIRDMLQAGYVEGASEKALQPSSLDLTVTDEIYRMRGSYLPRPGEPVRDIIKRGALYRASLEYPLERGGVYLIKLAETLKLPKELRASVSNKSSSGRIDLRARLLADGLPCFDAIPAGYEGSLWIEVAPKSFPVRLHAGDRINQMRFFNGDARLNTLEHRFAYDKYKLLREQNGDAVPADTVLVREGVTMTIDLTGDPQKSDIIGWRSHPGPWGVLDTARFDHDPREFFEPIYRPKNGEITLVPGAFYILVTKEKILVPPTMAAEMANYDPSKGEFRSHFAGFFDPGWGWRPDEAARGDAAVLEVETYGHECVVHDGQPICLMTFERMLTVPERLYGSDLKSNYHAQQGPKLAKWFASDGERTPTAPESLPKIVTPPLSIEPSMLPWEDDGRIDLG